MQQYPFDIPTEAFSFEIFKQAFVAVQSCVVHLQVTVHAYLNAAKSQNVSGIQDISTLHNQLMILVVYIYVMCQHIKCHPGDCTSEAIH